MESSAPIWTPNAEIMATELPDAVVLLDEGGEMYQLREVARTIWLALPGDLDALTQAVTNTFEVEPQAARDDVTAFLTEMAALQLLTSVAPTP